MGSIEREFQELEHEAFVKFLKNKDRTELAKLIYKYAQIIKKDDYSGEFFADFHSTSKKFDAVVNEYKKFFRD